MLLNKETESDPTDFILLSTYKGWVAIKQRNQTSKNLFQSLIWISDLESKLPIRAVGIFNGKI